MSGGGISLQTTIVQLGSVAQTQLKGQQTSHPTTPFSDRLEANQEAKVQRVRQADEAERKRIDPDARRDQRRREQAPGDREEPLAPDGAALPADEVASGEEATDVGRHIDTRA